MTAVLEARELTKLFQTEAERVQALHAVSLTAAAGEFIALMGPSGSGKSTLLQVLGGLDEPTSGTVTIGGVLLSGLTDRERTKLRRRKIGFVFQAFNLIPTLTAAENVALPLLLDGRRPDQERIVALLTDLGLGERVYHKPVQLSGGQQQRVAVARALITDPDIILADEPTGNLDSAMADEIVRLLRRCVDDFGRTVIMVTHDPKAAAYADRVIMLRDGRIVDETRMGGEADARTTLARLAESY